MTLPFRKIVIGIDFSDASLAAARWAASHLASDAELLLVHVVGVPRPPVYLQERLAATIGQSSVSVPRLRVALQGFADVLRCARVRVGVRTGVPWAALARVAAEVKADVICVGRGQKRKGSERFGATTTQRLLSIARTPVMVIPQGFTGKPNRVLVALSARPGGELVIPVARQLAKAWESRLEAIHVLDPEVVAAATDVFDPESLRTLAAEWAASAISTAGETVAVEPIIRAGDPGEELVTVARETDGISVVVIGRTAESVPAPSAGTPFRCGSTARMVLWAAPGPVLIVPLESAETYQLPLEAPMRGPNTRLRSQSTIARLSVLPSPRRWHPDGNGAA